MCNVLSDALQTTQETIVTSASWLIRNLSFDKNAKNCFLAWNNVVDMIFTTAPSSSDNNDLMVGVYLTTALLSIVYNNQRARSRFGTPIFLTRLQHIQETWTAYTPSCPTTYQQRDYILLTLSRLLHLVISPPQDVHLTNRSSRLRIKQTPC